MSPQPSLASPDHLYSVAPEGRALSFAILRLVVESPVRVWNPVTLENLGVDRHMKQLVALIIDRVLGAHRGHGQEQRLQG